MNDSIEKKWFIFIKEKHEGPFTISEVQDKFSKIALPNETYVWKEGMSDWKIASTLPEFQSISPVIQQTANPDISISVSSPNPETQGGFVEASPISASSESPQEEKKSDPPAPTEATTVTQMSPASSAPTLHAGPISPTEGPKVRNALQHLLSWKHFLVFGSTIVGLLVMAESYFLWSTQDDSSEFKPSITMALAEQFPFLTRWISTLPKLDISDEEYEDLKSVVKEKVEVSGPKFGLALSKKDLLFPELYLASNLSNGTKFKLKISGIPNTLLNWLTFEKEIEVSLSKNLSKTGAIRFPDGKPIPRGEYRITVYASDNQPQPLKNLINSSAPGQVTTSQDSQKDPKALVTKTYFLGGPRDAVYTSRLKEFHDRLREKATRELNEIKQFAATLENQFNETSERFLALKDGRARPRNKRQWSEFHQEWSKLQNNLSGIFSEWTPTTLHDQFFYGVLYQLIRQLGQSVEKVHAFQNTYFTSSQDPKTLQIQIGETTDAAKNALVLVKSKIEQAEKIPPTADGMPRTEGL